MITRYDERGVEVKAGSVQADVNDDHFTPEAIFVIDGA